MKHSVNWRNTANLTCHNKNQINKPSENNYNYCRVIAHIQYEGPWHWTMEMDKLHENDLEILVAKYRHTSWSHISRVWLAAKLMKSICC